MISFPGLLGLLVLLFRVVPDLGQQGVCLGVFTLLGGIGLHLAANFLGPGTLLIGVRRSVELSGGGFLFRGSGTRSRSRSGSTALGLLIILLQLGAVHFRVLPEAILHAPAKQSARVKLAAAKSDLEYSLELLNAVNTLGLLRGVHEAAECRLEFLSARAVGHATQARAIPVDLASLRVERSFLTSFLLESPSIYATLQAIRFRGWWCWLRLRMGDLLLPDLRGDGVEGLV